MKTHLFVTLIAIGFSSTCWAAGSDYGSASAAYQAQMKRDDPTLLNTDFIADRASSQAKRVTRKALEDADSAQAQAMAEAAAVATARGGRASSVNIASPQIYGTVRGNVYVITQRSRGRVTSVRP